MNETYRWRAFVLEFVKCVALVFLCGTGAVAQAPAEDLSRLSIESLMNVEVTSVSKRGQKLSQSAAAIFVITQDDIRRSGATNIPDLLRMVPGLEVAQINASIWAVTSRGFNGPFANKMLVLIDGRSIYSPAFSGVFWDIQDAVLEDIDRIEVIRGPGATVWGANAVNGVINIISKKAADTQGGLLAVGGGNLLHGFGEVREGGKSGAAAFYRVYGKYFRDTHFAAPSGGNASDKWQMGRAGFRVDWSSSSRDVLMFEGEMYGGQAWQNETRFTSLTPPFVTTFADQTSLAGGNALVRWTRNLSGTSDLSLQVYFDRTNRNNAIFGENRNTLDLDFQHHLKPAERQDLVWGAGFRRTADRIGSRFGLSLSPGSQGLSTSSAFVQDQFSLAGDHLFLTVGSKFEHNAYTGFEYQPSGRLLWKLARGQALWGAVSRAVRTPSRSDRSVDFDLFAMPGLFGTAVVVAVQGNPKSRSEDLLAYELGYRVEVSDRVSLDVAGYYNDDRNLQSVELGVPFLETNPLPPHIIVPETFGNSYRGHTYGVEIAGNWQVTNRWRLSPGYTFLRQVLIQGAASNDTTTALAAGDNPRNQFQVRSVVGPFHGFEFNSALFVIGKLPNQRIPLYSRFDSQLDWQVNPSLDLSFVVQNAFKSRHQEFGSTQLGQPASLIPRSAYGEIRWRF